MGIHRLMALLREKAPNSIKQVQLKSLTGYKIACDASMAIYQFLISTQGYNNYGLSELKDKDGNLTGHLQGLLSRSILMLENGIKPIWVFDGKPPELKLELLKERKDNKESAKEKMNKAIEEDDKDAVLKFAGQTVRVTSQMTEDAKRLIRALGLPCIEAPGEAEAECTYLVKQGHAYAVASEDMDCLTFGTERMIRGFNSKDEPVSIITLKDVLKELEITMNQFIDICILCGCDYTGTISNIGPIKAYNFIKEHETIENVLLFVDDDNLNNTKKKTKYEYSLENFKYDLVRKEFNSPLVLDNTQVNITFSKPDEEEIRKFLIEEKGFSENRINSALSRLESAKNKSNQGRIDSFFKVKEIVPSTNKVVSSKKDEKKEKGNKKKNVIY